jgi:Zn-dependent M28 family amino/carboxypeptidase
MGDGAPEDFNARADEIQGKIVLTNSVVKPGKSTRWIHRQEKYGRSLLAGAKGFIFVNHYPGFGPATGGIAPAAGGAAAIPGISLSAEDGAFLQRLIKRQGAVTVRLASNDVIMPMISWNVIGDLPGKQDPSQIVMLGCHYDGHDISQGAADPASGTVALMEAARVLARYAPDLPYTIRFALWGIEEIGLIGSTCYVAEHESELDRIRFYLNMDMAGVIDPKDIVLNEWPELAPLFRKWSEEMALEFGVGQSVSAHSDHFPFLMAGVPTGGINSLSSNSSGRGYGHTMYDTLDKVALRGLREAAVLAARLALRIAIQETWPAKRRAAEAVNVVLDSPEHRELRDLTAQVAAFYAM